MVFVQLRYTYAGMNDTFKQSPGYFLPTFLSPVLSWPENVPKDNTIQLSSTIIIMMESEVGEILNDEH